ncbi:IclR family transcriptional regulator [Cohaesibacter celericrescens]|uniref:IclR family transcriptional regulator n=1 Tax=Cohaesibacter celericrescens TaxID=2067669 RepID=UPI0035682AAA
MTNSTVNQSGTQSIDRAVNIINIIAQNHAAGTSFSELMTQSGLTRPTARRLAQALIQHDFIKQDTKSRLFFLGPRICELGLMVLPSFDFEELYHPAVMRLAKGSGDTVFFNRLTGNTMTCLVRESGDFPVKAFVLDVGIQRTIGLGAGGLAVLADMTPDIRERMIAKNQDALEDFYGDESVMNRIIENALDRGYVCREVPELGIRTIAMAIRDSLNQPFAAISVSSISGRMQGAHKDDVLSLLREEILSLNERLRQSRPVV